ncbi:MAG: toprim domain-containing protein [Paracoccaceae bacterium]
MASALSAGHLSAIQFSPHLRRLYIVRDNDPAGDAARDSLVDRTIGAGIEAITLSPMQGDFNDDLVSFSLEGASGRRSGCRSPPRTSAASWRLRHSQRGP